MVLQPYEPPLGIIRSIVNKKPQNKGRKRNALMTNTIEGMSVCLQRCFDTLASLPLRLIWEIRYHFRRFTFAGVAELADAYGSGPYGLRPMKVQVLSPAPELAKATDQVAFSRSEG